MRELRVAVLGATGIIGQRYVELLLDHPFLRLSAVAGHGSVGRRYSELVRGPLRLRRHRLLDELVVQEAKPEALEADLIFSALPARAAAEKEPLFAGRGFAVLSDSSAHRLEADVPLLIPEVNPEHLELLRTQRARRGWRGFLLATPNCTAVGLGLALKPLHEAFGIKRVVVSTLQSISGAGYPGLSALDILGNVIPYIEGEEEKVERETRKILGRLVDGGVQEADLAVEAMCHRVPTVEGHLESALVEFKGDVTPEQAREALAGFTGLPQRLKLPSAPGRPILVVEEQDRPQPRIDSEAGSVPGMSVVVGRIRRAQASNALKLSLLVHNEIRGGAGGAILAAELLAALGLLGGS
ncbi:MAG: aspartate-semialdehyde dehydrogenase [Nitrospiraceae bacterium]